MPEAFTPDPSKPLLPQVVKVGLLPLNHRLPNGHLVMDTLTANELEQCVPPRLLSAIFAIYNPIPQIVHTVVRP